MLHGTALQDQPHMVGGDPPTRLPVDGLNGYQYVHLVATKINWAELGVDPNVISATVSYTHLTLPTTPYV